MVEFMASALIISVHLFGDGDDRSEWMPADLVREDGRVDESEGLGAGNAQGVGRRRQYQGEESMRAVDVCEMPVS